MELNSVSPQTADWSAWLCELPSDAGPEGLAGVMEQLLGVNVCRSTQGGLVYNLAKGM